MLPQLLFDEEASLLRYEFLPTKPSPLFARDSAEVEKRFLASLRPGDQRRFRKYCLFPPTLSDGRDLTFELFSLLSFPPYRHAFCEHSCTARLFYTSVFLAKEATEFHTLISPSSLTYASTNECILRELFLLSGIPEDSPDNLPPEILPLLAKLPQVVYALRSPDHGRGYCDIRKLTDTTLDELRENPMFMHTELLCAPFSGASSLWNLTFPSELYVHILTSVLTAFLTVSASHRIEMELFPSEPWFNPRLPGVDVRISTTLPNDPPTLRRMNESGTLRVIANPGTVTEIHLATAAVLASIAEIETSVLTILSSCRLEICLSVLSSTEAPVPEFRYRDPYAAVSAFVGEFMEYFASLSAPDAIPSANGEQ